MNLTSVETTYRFDNFDTGATDTVEIDVIDGLIQTTRTSKNVKPPTLLNCLEEVMRHEAGVYDVTES